MGEKKKKSRPAEAEAEAAGEESLTLTGAHISHALPWRGATGEPPSPPQRQEDNDRDFIQILQFSADSRRGRGLCLNRLVVFFLFSVQCYQPLKSLCRNFIPFFPLF